MSKPPALPEAPDPPANLRQAIQDLASAADAATLRRVLADHPGLLHPSLHSFLTRRLQEAWGQGDKAGTRDFLACRAFLARCRTQGVEAVLAEPLALPLARSSPIGQLLESTYEWADLPRRAELARRALADVRRATEPDLWAALQRELADCLAQSEGPDRVERLEEALNAYRAALEVRGKPPHVGSPMWAQTLHAMAATLRRRVKGERADNLKQAFQLYREALTVRTRKDYPGEWAETQHDLGTTWLEMPVGDRAENVQKGIQCYKDALTVRTRQEMPDLWAETTHDLAIAYSEHPGEDRAQNLEKAIELCQAVLEVRSPDKNPLDWGRSQVALGNAYVMRLRGGRTENLEQATDCYKKALKALSCEAYPADWARTHYNLAVAYRHRPTGNRADNLGQAIEEYRQALEVYTPETYPIEWAHVQTGLGNTYCQPEVGQRVHNLEQAITCYRKALTVRTRDSDPHGWATVQNNLGNAYADRISGERADNQEKAIACYHNALRVRTREAAPARWAETMNNLGTVYSERLRGNRAKNLAQAIQHFEMALKVATPETFPVNARRAARNLGNLRFEERHWAQARDAYATAIRAAEVLYRASYSPGGKEAEIAENTALYERMVQACLEEPDYAAALVAAEGGKARTFLDQMGQSAFPPPPDLPLDLLQREKKAIEELRGQEQDLATLSGRGARADRGREPSREREIIEQRRKTLAALEAVWDEMARHYPAARSYVAARRGEPMTWDGLCTLAERLGRDAALVEFYTLPDEIIVFVLRAGWEAPQVHRVPVGQRQLHHRVVSFFREVAEHPSYPMLNQTWQRLAAPLLSDVLPHLKDAELVYLIPQGLLHYLPLHALEVDGAPLIEHFPVAYAPSAAVLGRVTEQAEEKATDGPGSALVIGNPTGDLPFSESEAQIIAQHFSVRPYLRQQATKTLVLDEMKGRRNVHLACHGNFRPLEPLQSGIVLHGGVLTAQEILALRLQAELLVLSACQTAQQEVGRGDELVGLTRALLYAGASSLVVSLWSVNDRSTGELMRRFYDMLYEEGPSHRPSLAEVLRQAMLDIRRQPGWEHPYYWAPFILVGGV